MAAPNVSVFNPGGGSADQPTAAPKRLGPREQSRKMLVEALIEGSAGHANAGDAADAIEEAIFKLHPDEKTKEYRAKLRNVCIGLKGPRNLQLRVGVLRGAISGEDVVTLDSKALESRAKEAAASAPPSAPAPPLFPVDAGNSIPFVQAPNFGGFPATAVVPPTFEAESLQVAADIPQARVGSTSATSERPQASLSADAPDIPRQVELHRYSTAALIQMADGQPELAGSAPTQDGHGGLSPMRPVPPRIDVLDAPPELVGFTASEKAVVTAMRPEPEANPIPAQATSAVGQVSQDLAPVGPPTLTVPDVKHTLAPVIPTWPPKPGNIATPSRAKAVEYLRAARGAAQARRASGVRMHSLPASPLKESVRMQTAASPLGGSSPQHVGGAFSTEVAHLKQLLDEASVQEQDLRTKLATAEEALAEARAEAASAASEVAKLGLRRRPSTPAGELAAAKAAVMRLTCEVQMLQQTLEDERGLAAAREKALEDRVATLEAERCELNKKLIAQAIDDGNQVEAKLIELQSHAADSALETADAKAGLEALQLEFENLKRDFETSCECNELLTKERDTLSVLQEDVAYRFSDLKEAHRETVAALEKERENVQSMRTSFEASEAESHNELERCRQLVKEHEQRCRELESDRDECRRQAAEASARTGPSEEEVQALRSELASTKKLLGEERRLAENREQKAVAVVREELQQALVRTESLEATISSLEKQLEAARGERRSRVAGLLERTRTCVAMPSTQKQVNSFPAQPIATPPAPTVSPPGQVAPVVPTNTFEERRDSVLPVASDLFGVSSVEPQTALESSAKVIDSCPVALPLHQSARQASAPRSTSEFFAGDTSSPPTSSALNDLNQTPSAATTGIVVDFAKRASTTSSSNERELGSSLDPVNGNLVVGSALLGGNDSPPWLHTEGDASIGVDRQIIGGDPSQDANLPKASEDLEIFDRSQSAPRSSHTVGSNQATPPAPPELFGGEGLALDTFYNNQPVAPLASSSSHLFDEVPFPSSSDLIGAQRGSDLFAEASLPSSDQPRVVGGSICTTFPHAVVADPFGNSQPSALGGDFFGGTEPATSDIFSSRTPPAFENCEQSSKPLGINELTSLPNSSIDGQLASATLSTELFGGPPPISHDVFISHPAATSASALFGGDAAPAVCELFGGSVTGSTSNCEWLIGQHQNESAGDDHVTSLARPLLTNHLAQDGSSNLFGSRPASTPAAFGAAQVATSNPFGDNSSKATSAADLFDGEDKTSSSLFGVDTPSKSGVSALFGGAWNVGSDAFGAHASAPSGLFGVPQVAGASPFDESSFFGAAAATPAPIPASSSQSAALSGSHPGGMGGQAPFGRGQLGMPATFASTFCGGQQAPSAPIQPTLSSQAPILAPDGSAFAAQPMKPVATTFGTTPLGGDMTSTSLGASIPPPSFGSTLCGGQPSLGTSGLLSSFGAASVGGHASSTPFGVEGRTSELFSSFQSPPYNVSGASVVRNDVSSLF